MSRTEPVVWHMDNSNVIISPTPEAYSLSEIHPDEKKLLYDKLSEIKDQRDQHTVSYDYWRKIDLYIGFTCTLLAGVLSSSLGIQYTMVQPSHALNITQLALSSIAFMLGAAQKFFNVTARTQNHYSSFRAFSQLYNSTHLRLVKNHLSKKDVLEMLSDMTDAVNILSMYAADTN